MPLIKGKSKKAFEHNIKAEMHSGKPQNQSLAIAYSIKRKNAKKKASGGTVESGSKDMNMAKGGSMYAKGGEVKYKNESAVTESRPMPDEVDNDHEMVSKNNHRRSNGEDYVLDNPTVKQAQKNNGREVKPIKYPRMVASDIVQSRLRDEEDDLQSSAKPESYGSQPPKHDNEEDAMSSGHPVRDMERQHNNGRKAYAAGGKVVDEDAIEHREREDEAHLQLGTSPSEDEGDMYAEKHNEEGPDRQGPRVPDMEDEHSTHRRPYAGGGEIDDAEENMDDDMEMNPAHDHYSEDDSEDQPDDSQLMHEASIASAIMAKRKKMARGGAILSEDSMETTDDDQADLNRNSEEDANMEDKASFDSLRKENYDEDDALRQADNPLDAAMESDDEKMDSHDPHGRDMISMIRSKMKKRSPISR